MKINLSAFIAAVLITSCLTLSIRANEPSFRAQYLRLSQKEQQKVQAEATQKEDYGQLPKIKRLNDSAVIEFCKLLPRGLETFLPEKMAAHNQSFAEKRRTELWARYLSCQDSLLYYEGHRFFKSGHYSELEVSSSISEIKKVMSWLVAEERKL